MAMIKMAVILLIMFSDSDADLKPNNFNNNGEENFTNFNEGATNINNYNQDNSHINNALSSGNFN